MVKKKNRKNRPSRQRRSFAYKHTVGAILAISAFVMLLDTAIIQALLNDIVGLGYAGIFLSGFISVSFFTAAPAVVLLLAFAHSYNPFIVAAIAGSGAMVGDFIIIKFVEDKIAHELKPIARRLKLVVLSIYCIRNATNPSRLRWGLFSSLHRYPTKQA